MHNLAVLPTQVVPESANIHLKLIDAVRPDVLEEQVKVAFSACQPGYLKDFEGPLKPVQYGNGEKELRAVQGEDWT